MSNPSITADKTPWYQWDTGLTVTVSGGEMTECHFANRKQGTAYVQAVINGVARVPDELLQVAAPIKAYGYVSDGAGGQTYVEQTFEVIARNIPADYTYTKTIQKTIRDAEVARDEAVQAAKDAKASELAADDSAVDASNSAQSAGEYASAAATSASNAAKSAGDAAKSASDAKTAADKAVEDASELLKTYTDNAKTSADNAATSASNAADAASAASGSASDASTSASEAATSAQEAKGAAGNAAREVLAATKANADAAAQSATDAATAKAGAEAAKGEAAASASNAAESATAAAKSASDAAASVDAINVIAPTHTATSATAENTALAIGNGSHSHGSYSIAIGASSDCGNASSVAMGDSARTTRDAEFSIGSISGGRYLANVKSPELDTDAPNKKYTDDNDANTLSEAKKYTDDNTSNALVGTVSGKMLHVEDAWPGKPLGLTIDGSYKQDGTPSPDNPVPITVVENPVLKVTGADTSADGASLPITLPSEHPYLAALPDGTHDEIVIDKDGNASLVARVKRVLLDKSSGWIFNETGGGNGAYNVETDGETGSVALTQLGFREYGFAAWNAFIFNGRPFIVDSDATDVEGVIEKFGTGSYMYYKLATPVTYSLGKLDIPSLPETISNVWIEANLTPECAMTYKQDVNVVIADLTAQIAALKGTNDIVHDDSTESPDDAIDVLENDVTLDVTDHTIA